jgi:hypothetical protein
MRFLVPAAAILTCAFALYFTNSVLDQIVVDGGAVRVALVPDWKVLVTLIGASALGVAVFTRRRAVLLPVLATAIVILPFAPVLPDYVPALQLPAGPLKWVVWLTVAGMLAWSVAQAGIGRVALLPRLSRSHATVLIGLLTALAGVLAASRLAGTVLFPAGDEPHYLVMAQSIWRDGDLKIENNHARGDYREYYFRAPLKPDYLTRGVDNEIYSIHPVGMPVLMAPVYALGGYWAVVSALVLFAAASAASMWRFTANAVNAPGAATFAWSAIALTSPFLFSTFTVYPEIIAGFAAVVAFTLAVSANAAQPGFARWFIIGFCVASLPWLSTKYAPMSAALVTIALLRILRHRAFPQALAVVLPYGISLVAWLTFFYVFWGTPLPMAPYGTMVQTRPANLLFGAPGLLFDQEYGLLAYAPVYILALTGLLTMWSAGGEMRRRAVEIAITFGALLGTVGAFRIWWGGTATPGRPLASGLLLLMVPIAVAARRAPAVSGSRASHQVLLWVSVGVAITLATAQQGLLINNGRDGTSSLLEYWSPYWAAWAAAPTFIFHEPGTAWMHTLAWLAAAFAAAILLARWRLTSAAGASLAAMTTLVAALVLVTIVVPALPHDPPLPPAQVAARSHIAALDQFDRAKRPVAIRYDPFRFEDANAVVPLATLGATPALHTSPQPTRVLHNARFSLPAGRYRLDIDWGGGTRAAETIGLQVGRMGPPWQSWSVQPHPGSRWSSEFELPADMSFVGLRGSTDLERAIARFTISPIVVIDEHARPKAPTVLAVRQYGPVAVLAHDEAAEPEPEGFWSAGRRETPVTFVRDRNETPLTLRVRNGPEPNRVHFAASGWAESLDLEPGKTVTITVPVATRVVTLDIHAENGFDPRKYDPTSQDTRLLGVWVEVYNAR